MAAVLALVCGTAHTLLAFFLATSLAAAAPVTLIFDTDMGNDVDDLMAWCTIHNLETRGAVELHAVGNCG